LGYGWFLGYGLLGLHYGLIYWGAHWLRDLSLYWLRLGLSCNFLHTSHLMATKTYLLYHHHDEISIFDRVLKQGFSVIGEHFSVRH